MEKSYEDLQNEVTELQERADRFKLLYHETKEQLLAMTSFLQKNYPKILGEISTVLDKK